MTNTDTRMQMPVADKKAPMSTTDRIEKEILLHAPRSRVWRALTDVREFAEWFGFKMEGEFRPGSTVKAQRPGAEWEHFKVEFKVLRMEPETYFSYRWHPYPGDPKMDYSTEPETLVEIRLEDDAQGTRLTVVESGFDRLLAARHAEVFPKHEKGWVGQLENIRKYVDA